MRAVLAGTASFFLALGLATSGHAGSRAEEILERFENANQWRDHVMVVAHRAGGLQDGKRRFAENSIAALRDATSLGAEMVEIDIRRSADGELIVMHDSWLDRTTDCKGEVLGYAMTELRKCHLVVEGTGDVTAEPVPTLREYLSVAKDKILVNLDNKLDTADLVDMVALARAMEMEEQVVVKANLWNAARVATVKATMARVGQGFQFMPIMADDAVRDPAFVEAAGNAFAVDAVEMITWRGDAEKMTDTGGPLFSAKVKAVAVRGNWHIWVDTHAIVNKPGGFLSGGRGDEMAVAAGFPNEVFGFWAERGATMIQTDEPRAAINWLAANGYRVPYADVEEPVASVAGQADLSQLPVN
ncbi:glycerophosphodiester phosphodiesterase family protein [Aminobacter anthyllidis]|uniref:glycerophosphodiester phosphodiesterase family protein n=1 Tax=Aminobacter anthyllidis TaxID=1035067 RepID=UPI00245425C6|nr:glycerophosphodiester phosphodiesterase family protein [Aminobacter anthyllidis]MDH4985380.1 glycerophosphodiester phosphodiesterase family protein [Aminobacter anthyllidis]